MYTETIEHFDTFEERLFNVDRTAIKLLHSVVPKWPIHGSKTTPNNVLSGPRRDKTHGQILWPPATVFELIWLILLTEDWLFDLVQHIPSSLEIWLL